MMNQSRTVTLRQIDRENIEAVLGLTIKKEQDSFVAPVMKSLAYAYAAGNSCRPFAIYDAEKLVGYTSLIFEEEEQCYNIWHFLIDQQYQGQGYGRLALEETLRYLKTQPFGETQQVALAVEEDNLTARKLYSSCGFYETGERVENELVLFYDFA